MLKITNIATKNYNGIEYKTFTANDGEKEVKASIWSKKDGDNTFYASIVEGANVNGFLVKNDKGYWILRSELTPPSFIKNKTIEGVEKLQDRKYEYQNLVQENTNTNIKISSTFRDATLFTTTFCKKEDDKEIKEYWLKIRKWLWENWDNKDSYPTHDLTPDDIPF